jgi:mRNA interferase YafQ
MYSVDTTKRFDKDLKRCLKRGLDMQHLYDAIALLRINGSLPAQYRPHKLVNQRVETWECHIEPDWLMTWEQNDTELTLLFLRTGTHSDLF